MDLDKTDAVALTRSGHALGYLANDVPGGIALVAKALALNPNLAAAWFLGGFLKIWHGEPEVAIDYFGRAMRLSPVDPEFYRMQAGMAVAHLLLGQFDASSSWAEKAFRELPSFLLAAAILSASHALAGKAAEAQRVMKALRQLDPKLRLASVSEWLPIQLPAHLDTIRDGLRKAGLPE